MRDFQEVLKESHAVVVPEIVDGDQILKRYKNGREEKFTRVRFVGEMKGLEK
mgnify:FL=1